MTIANVEMAASWDGAEGAAWAANAEAYENTGRHVRARFFAEVPIGASDRVLDLGCGTGRLTRDAARLASGGHVTGVDLSSAMLGYARDAAAREGLANVEFVRADAQVHPFGDGAYDLAVSSFGAMFFADPVAAFANVRRALHPGGRLALLTWRELARNEWLSAVREAVAAGRVLPDPPVSVPGPFGLADEEHVRHVLTEAGFAGVELRELAEPMDLGATVDAAWRFVTGMGITIGLTQDLDEESRAKAFDALRRTVEAHATPDGVLFGSSAWLVTARAGAG